MCVFMIVWNFAVCVGIWFDALRIVDRQPDEQLAQKIDITYITGITPCTAMEIEL